MRQILMTVLLVLFLTGCASTSPYGNYVPTTAHQPVIATDAVQQLIELYPPAKTQFACQQATPDLFGRALVSQLREQGYAVLEFHPADKGKASTTSPQTIPAIPLRYVLDQVGTSNVYRLILWVGNQSITRPYLKGNDTFVPIGDWARKE